MVIPVVNLTKKNVISEKQKFDEQVERWIKEVEDRKKAESSVSSASRSYRSGSSNRSQKVESRVKLKVAATAVDQASV